MRNPAALVLLAAAFGLAPAQTTPDAAALATRMSQLMESTAVAVPGLIHASEALRQLAGSTLAAMRNTPLNPALDFRFINEMKAYLALSETFPASQMPAVAEQQFGELRQDLVRFQQSFERALETRTQGQAAADADPNGLRRYSEANTKILPLGTLPRVVFLGDALTEDWRLNEAYPGRDFVNRGIGGQTTTQLLGRFMQDVVLLHPKVVVIQGGIEDIAHGIPSYAIEDELTMLGDLAKAHGIRPVFASVAPVSAEAARTHPTAVLRQVNRWIEEYCAREGFAYLDYFSALSDGSGQLPSDLTDDGMHPNAKGYKIMAPVALDAVNRALASVSGAPDRTTTTKRRFALPGINKQLMPYRALGK